MPEGAGVVEYDEELVDEESAYPGTTAPLTTSAAGWPT
jgi:hypothetical protein